MVTNHARQEIIWIVPKNYKVAQTTGTVDFLIRVQAFLDPLRGDLPHVQFFMNDGPNPLA